jgi:hypothetical protein
VIGRAANAVTATPIIIHIILLRGPPASLSAIVARRSVNLSSPHNALMSQADSPFARRACTDRGSRGTRCAIWVTPMSGLATTRPFGLLPSHRGDRVPTFHARAQFTLAACTSRAALRERTQHREREVDADVIVAGGNEGCADAAGAGADVQQPRGFHPDRAEDCATDCLRDAIGQRAGALEGRRGDVERGSLHDVASLSAEWAFRMRRPRSLRNCASAIPIGANKAW